MKPNYTVTFQRVRTAEAREVRGATGGGEKVMLAQPSEHFWLGLLLRNKTGELKD